MKNNQNFAKQLKFIVYYLSEGEYTYSNLRRSALKAGYSDSYARKIGSYLNWQEMAKTLACIQNKLKCVLEKEIIT